MIRASFACCEKRLISRLLSKEGGLKFYFLRHESNERHDSAQCGALANLITISDCMSLLPEFQLRDQESRLHYLWMSCFCFRCIFRFDSI